MFIVAVVFCSTFSVAQQPGNLPSMYFGDTVRTGVPFSKDPHVIWFQGKYLMYYSVPAYKNKDGNSHGWGIAVAGSDDLVNWKRIGERSRL
jgi:hypothetical protein